jgi:hypothetical protein
VAEGIVNEQVVVYGYIIHLAGLYKHRLGARLGVPKNIIGKTYVLAIAKTVKDIVVNRSRSISIRQRVRIIRP